MAFGTDQSESEGTDQTIGPILKSSKSQKYSCKFCTSSFRRKDALDRHEFHHTNEVKFSDFFPLNLLIKN